jgi:hypothetical protein
MKIGDICMTSGNGPLSLLIRKYQKIVLHAEGPGAELSHVAMVGPDATHVFEATTFNAWAGKDGVKGVQVNPYQQWVENYNGRIWIREQKKDAFTGGQYEAMYDKMESMIGRDYEHGIPGALELAFVGWQIPGLSKWLAGRLRTNTDLHCSEAVAEVLQAVGLLQGLRPNKLPPCMWWDGIKELDKYYHEPKEIKP